MHRSRTVIVCLLAVSLVACAPAAAPPSSPTDRWETESELTTWLGSEPDTIDPQRASFRAEASVIGMVYEPLLSYDPATLRLVPAAASALPEVSSDGLTYTYRLRAGLTYSDGSPLTARAFAFAFTRLCDPTTRGAYTFVAYAIAGCEAWNALPPLGTPAAKLDQARAALGVRAIDDTTIEFRLREPAPQFPHATALWIGAPIRETDFAGRGWFDRPTAETYIGNGPFKLVEWKRGQKLVFERNGRYRTSVRLKRWTKVFSSDAAVMRSAYDEGRLDAVSIVPSNEVERDALLLRPDLIRRLGTCTSYIAFNTQRPPFDDPLVRLAFARALDREELVRTVEMTGRAAASFVPHDQPGHAHDDRVQSFDPAEARALLAASRYGPPVDGRIGGLDLAFMFVPNARSTARVRWATDNWLGHLAVTVKPDPVINHGYGQLIKRPQALPQLSLMGWCADYPDAQDWYGSVFRSGRNRSGFANTAFDAIVDKADRERDPTAREALYQGASYVLSRSAPAAYLTWSENWTLVRPDVRGYRVSAFDWDFAQFSLATIYRSRRATP